MVPCIKIFINNENNDYAVFIRTVLITISVLIVFFVTGFSVIWNIVKDKLKFEKKRQYIVNKMNLTLFDNAVLGDISTLSIFYEKFHKAEIKEKFINEVI